MFCSKCGHELSASAKFCPKCGTPTSVTAAPVEAPAPEVEAPVEEPATATEETITEEPKAAEAVETEAPAEETSTEEPVSENTEEAPVESPVEEAAETEAPAEEELTASTLVTDQSSADYNYGFNPADIPEPTKNPGSKKGLFIGVGIVAAVVVIAVVLCLVFGLFATPAKMLSKAINNSKNNVIESYETGYNSMKEAYTDVSGDMTFSIEASLGDQAKTLVNELGSGMGYDLSWIDGAKADVAMDVQESQIGFDVKASLNGQEIGSVDAIVDANSEQMYLSVPEVIDGAIAEDADMDAEEIMDFIASYTETLATYADAYPDPKELDKAISKYTDIVAADLGKAEISKGKAEITAGDVTAKYTELSIELDKKTELQLELDLISTFKDDEELKELLRPLVEAELAAYEDSYYEDFDTMWDDMLTELESTEDLAKEDLEAIEDDEDLNEDIGTVYVYLDKKFNFTGIAFEPEEEEGKLELYHVEDGDESGMLFRFEDDSTSMIFEGQGETKKGLLNGTYTFTLDDEEYFTVELVDFDKDSYEKGTAVKGDMIFSLGTAVTDYVYEEDAKLFALAKYDFSFDTQTTSGTIGLDILAGDESFAKLTMTYAMEDVEDMTIPSTTYNLETMTDEESFEFIKSLKLGTITDNLKKAGVPEEFYEKLSTLDAAIQSGDDMEIYYALSALMGEDTSYYDDYGYDDYYDYDYEDYSSMTYDEFAEYYRNYIDENGTDEDIQYYYDLFQE